MSFRGVLGSDRFIITAEISPPKGANVKNMVKDACLIKEVVHAINITDNQRAIMRMSSLSACSIMKNEGYETIMHLTCRDRNRIALQSELLGASSMGINNILVMSGDHPILGDHEGAKPVYDLDSIQLLGVIDKLNRGFDLPGNHLEGKADICAGSVTNIVLNEIAFFKLEKKIKMGARFIQTQAVYDLDMFSDFIKKVEMIKEKHKSGIKIIAGIIPLRSKKNAEYLNSNISGIRVPEKVIDRMRNAKDQKIEGMKIAAEMINELHGMCDGVHIMPIVGHENTVKILEMAGVV